MAHKKAGGSSRNGRDSQSKRLGIKSYGGELLVQVLSLSGKEALNFIPEKT